MLASPFRPRGFRTGGADERLATRTPVTDEETSLSTRSSRSLSPTLAGAVLFGAVTLLIACSSHGSVPPNSALVPSSGAGRSSTFDAGARRRHRGTATPIQHVFIIIQENRSFDNLFNGYPGANTVTSGMAIPVGSNFSPIPGATPMTVALQPTSLGTSSPSGSQPDCWDIRHGLGQFNKAYDKGKNDGFSEQPTVSYSKGCMPAPASQYPQYAFVPPVETQPYWNMAQNYVLADNMFASNIDASFVAHQYLIAGWADHSVNFQANGKYYSWGCDNPLKVPTVTKTRTLGAYQSACFNYGTLASALEGKGYDWRYYTVAQSYGGPTGYYWSAFDAINSVRNGPEWVGGADAKVINPPNAVATDAASGNIVTGVTWVTPWIANSDHASSWSTSGPDWVASVVNAIGSNTALWNTSAIFVVWDDWGGWYDHVPPQWLDYDGLGFRVPMLVISPYAKQGYVTHVPYEFGSVLKFVENNFGLGPVTPSNCCYGKPGSDVRANDPTSDVFNFSATPRPFVTIPSLRKKDFFSHQVPDYRPADNE
jgi:phospholipase C